MTSSASTHSTPVLVTTKGVVGELSRPALDSSGEGASVEVEVSKGELLPLAHPMCQS
jgi:hypothetical protein